MKNISLNINKALGVISKEQIDAQEAKANECIATLHNAPPPVVHHRRTPDGHREYR